MKMPAGINSRLQRYKIVANPEQYCARFCLQPTSAKTAEMMISTSRTCFMTRSFTLKMSNIPQLTSMNSTITMKYEYIAW